MRSVSQSRGIAAGQGGTAAARLREAELVAEKARDLRAMVWSVNQEEFNWQDAHYDHDSRQGRELLFLMANREWIRATSEIVDVTRADEIQTTIKVDIDLSQITHEAFRGRKESLWLPVSVQPPLPRQRLEPDLFATVTDAAGSPVPMLPAADLRHQMSAAMAEIIVKMAVSHLPNPTGAKGEADPGENEQNGSPIGTRDERLILAAAIYRMMRHDPVSGSAGPVAEQAKRPSRITEAETRLLRLIGTYIKLLEDRVETLRSAVKKASKEPRFAPQLADRAIKVLQALMESVIVVVQMDYDSDVSVPSVLTVRVPIRKLRASRPFLFNPRTWIIKPYGRLEIDVLLPTADADRQIQVNLPKGVSIDESAARRRERQQRKQARRQPTDSPERQADKRKKSRLSSPRLDIRVREPSLLADLSASMEQIFPDLGNPPTALVGPFVALAQDKSAQARHMLRHYMVSNKKDRPPDGTGDIKADPALERLATALDEADKAADPDLAELKTAWEDYRDDSRYLFRRTLAEGQKTPIVVARAGMIENVSERATPRRAAMSIDVTVDDHDYFSTARSSTFMGLILMLGILAFLRWSHRTSDGPAVEALAIVLTLFVTIQADRIERPDRSTLRGRLFTLANWLIAASVLPALTLALALAFRAQGQTAQTWAKACISAQVLFLVLMWRGPFLSTGWLRIGNRRIFRTDEPDYQHFEALGSDYWRNTTAQALMMGRKASGYVSWQKAELNRLAKLMQLKTGRLITWHGDYGIPREPSNILALLRSGTPGQAITFLVFRGKPTVEWLAASEDCREVILKPDRLAPTDSVTSTVDVFVGIRRDELLKIKEHPLVLILRAAKNRLIVLDAQLPVPPPAAGYKNRRWARIKLALRDADDIRRFTSFLNKIYSTMGREEVDRHVVVIEAVQNGRKYFIRGCETGAVQMDNGKEEEQLRARDLDIVHAPDVHGERARARTWRVLTICADARSNIESDIIRHLAAECKQSELTGLTYTLVHGKAVMVLLVHEPQVNQVASLPAGRMLPRASNGDTELEKRLGTKMALANIQVVLDKRLSKQELGPEIDDPMLRANFHLQDRPGAFLTVIDSISDVLRKDLRLEHQAWSISYARLEVLTGQVATGQLTIRADVPAEKLKGWSPDPMGDIERRRETLAAEEVPSQVIADSPDAIGMAENPVISISRMTKKWSS